MPLTPNNREEHWLQGMVDGETTLTPNKRREYWYKEIIDAQGGGGGGGIFLANATFGESGAVLDKTWTEIHSAMVGGKICYVHMPDDEYSDNLYEMIISCGHDKGSGMYDIYVGGANGATLWEAATSSDYPSLNF